MIKVSQLFQDARTVLRLYPTEFSERKSATNPNTTTNRSCLRHRRQRRPLMTSRQILSRWLSRRSSRHQRPATAISVTSSRQLLAMMSSETGRSLQTNGTSIQTPKIHASQNANLQAGPTGQARSALPSALPFVRAAGSGPA